MANRPVDLSRPELWEQLRPRITAAWDGIPEGELDQTLGHWDHLVGLIRLRTRQPIHEIERRLDGIIADLEG